MTAARAAVLRQLAGAFDRFAEQEQLAVVGGRYDEAERAHGHALRLLRAFRLESDNPVPRGIGDAMPEHPHLLPIPGCARCEGVTR